MNLFHKLFGKKIRITGVSTPVGGVSLEYDESERGVAEELLTFLENRRVLYSPVSDKCPGGVIKSVQEIRDRVQDVREKTSRDSTLFKLASQIITTVFEFLEYACQDCKRLSTCDDCLIYEQGCVEGLLEFRKQMGVHIASICSEFGLVVNEPLKLILSNNEKQIAPYGICPAILDKKGS